MGRIALFNKGVPTEPDVITLLNTFGVPEEGRPVRYEEVAQVIGVVIDSYRFQTVTSAWRKRLRVDHGVILLARDRQFSVRDPSQRVILSKTKAQSGVKCFSDAIDIVAGTDRARLTEKERADSDKVQRIASLGQGAALAEARRRPAPALKAVGEKKESA